VACCVSSASARIRSRVARNRLPGEADPRYTRMRAGIQPGHLGNVGLSLTWPRQAIRGVPDNGSRARDARSDERPQARRVKMATRKVLLVLGVLALGAALTLAGSRADSTPPCGRTACSDEVAATNLSGRSRAACFKAVIAACSSGTCSCTSGGSDNCVCIPADGSCTCSPQPCTPGRACGSCIDSTCVVDTEGNVVCTGGPCRIVGCTASVQCQPGEVCVSGSGWCCHPCP